MEVIVMRHGERNDQPCYDRGFIGQGLELAPLTDNGVKQAEEAAKNPLIEGCSIIVSSPYTRCMQTAAIVSRIRNIPLADAGQGYSRIRMGICRKRTRKAGKLWKSVTELQEDFTDF